MVELGTCMWGVSAESLSQPKIMFVVCIMSKGVGGDVCLFVSHVELLAGVEGERHG